MPDQASVDRINLIFEDLLTCLKLSKSFQMKYSQNGQAYEILKYGSTINGLHNKNQSDLDLTFIINDFRIDHRKILEDIKHTIEKYESFPNRYTFQVNMPRLDNSGWILRFRDTQELCDIDLMVNKTSEIANSVLIDSYAKIDVRFQKMAFILKAWNKGISPIVHQRLNNYSLILMLIAFLQKERVLPNL